MSCLRLAWTSSPISSMKSFIFVLDDGRYLGACLRKDGRVKTKRVTGLDDAQLFTRARSVALVKILSKRWTRVPYKEKRSK